MDSAPKTDDQQPKNEDRTQLVQPLKGFRDFYPDDCAARNYLFAQWREVTRRYGFVEYEGPTLEGVDLYRKKSGGELVGQLFAFTDKGDREVTLRPEMTPTLARMVAARERDFKKPLKWFAISSFFRFEQPGKGRLREFYQLNCDLLGDNSPAADAEMVALAIDLFRSFGLGADDFVVRLNDRRVWESFCRERGAADPVQAAAELLPVIDKLERDPIEVTTGRLGALGIAMTEVQAFLNRSPSEVLPSLAALEGSLRARDLLGFVRFDATIVRGLNYYTGLVFEVFARQGKLRALAGGGRYDNLVATLSDGAVDLPALGFAAGDVTLLELLRTHPDAAARLDAAVRTAAAVDAYAIVADEAYRSQALATVQRLREAGLRVDYPLGSPRVGKQFQAAEQLGARVALVFGSEWPQVRVKALASRKEETVPAHQLVSHLGTGA